MDHMLYMPTPRPPLDGPPLLHRAHTDEILLKAVAEAIGVSGPQQRSPLRPWQMKRVTSFIDDHLGETIVVRDLAEVANLGISHFARCFRASFGISPHAYVLRKRMERARQLLVETQQPLLDIALECGLADQSHLNRLFRRYAGAAPGQWRKRIMAEARADGRHLHRGTITRPPGLGPVSGGNMPVPVLHVRMPHRRDSIGDSLV